MIMKFLNKRLLNFLTKFYPYLFFVILIVIFFWKSFILGQVPLPADLVVGAYFPWLDYKWGYDVGVPVKNLITSDVVSVIYPLRIYALELLSREESILWNPLMFGGYPLLANFQLGLLFPTIILYSIFSNASAWTTQIILQPLFAMVTSFVFLRHFRISKASSILGSVVYAFSGFNMIWMEWGAHSMTSAFIPLILYVIANFIESRKIKWGILLSLFITLQIFSGYPQLLIYTAFASILFILIVYWGKFSLNDIFWLIFYSTLGVLVSSVQLIPSLELLKESQRVNENLSYDLIYLPWQNWISFFAPDFYGNHATGNFWGIGNYTNNVGYSGIIPLLLSLVALCSFKKNNLVKLFVILFVVSLIFSFPFPWTKYLYSLNLPGIGASSLTRILILTNLAVAYLSAIGLELLSKKIKTKVLFVSFMPILVLMCQIIYSYIMFKNGSQNYLIGFRNLFFPLVYSFISFLLILVVYWKPKFSNVVLISIIFLSIAELFRFGWKYTPFSKPSLIFPSTPITNFLVKDKTLFRAHYVDVIPMNMWSAYGLQSVSGYDALYPLSIAKYIAVTNSDSVLSNPLNRHGSINNLNSKLFNLSNNKYVLAMKKNDKNEPSINGVISEKYNSKQFTKIFDDRSVAVLENKEVLPRIFFVSDWKIEKDDEKTLSLLLDPVFDLKNKIVISDDFNDFVQSEKIPKYEISNVMYQSGKVSFDLNSDTDGFIFLSDTYYLGWRSFVDGNEVKIFKADFAFRAIPVTKGSHNILFIYDPISFRIGKLVSGLSLFLLLLIFIYGYKKNR